jgi:hypothetical protein
MDSGFKRMSILKKIPSFEEEDHELKVMHTPPSDDYGEKSFQSKVIVKKVSLRQLKQEADMERIQNFSSLKSIVAGCNSL